MRVHLGASFGAVTQVRLSVCVNIALPVLRCVCVCVCIHAYTSGSLHTSKHKEVSVRFSRSDRVLIPGIQQGV